MLINPIRDWILFCVVTTIFHLWKENYYWNMCCIPTFENSPISPPIVFRILSNWRNVLVNSSENLQSLQGAYLPQPWWAPPDLKKQNWRRKNGKWQRTRFGKCWSLLTWQPVEIESLQNFLQGEVAKGSCNDRKRPGCGLQHARTGAERSSPSFGSVLNAGPGGDVISIPMNANV